MKSKIAAALVTAGLVLLPALLLVGCASSDPWRDACGRFGETGEAIQPHLKPAQDPSEEALYKAFDSAVKECLKAKDK